MVSFFFEVEGYLLTTEREVTEDLEKLLFKRGKEDDTKDVLQVHQISLLYRIPFLLGVNFRVILMGMEKDT